MFTKGIAEIRSCLNILTYSRNYILQIDILNLLSQDS